MRTVFTVDSLGGIDHATGQELMMVKAERAPFLARSASKYWPFRLSRDNLPAWETLSAVLEHGRMVRDELCKHPGVKDILNNLAQTALGQTQPIFVKLSEGEAELITWEALCNKNNKFFALDQRWPIARISDPISGQSRPPATLSSPVKVLAVISAFDIIGQKKEWEMFQQAAQAAHGNGLPVRLRLLVGDKATRESVQAAISNGLDWVEVSHVENTGARVIQDIIAWAPNVVHFFCHGYAGSTPSEQALELATASDYLDKERTSGSVRIRVTQLVDMSMTLANPWLLTLNCCSGAQGAKELHSIAHQAVSAGFPAAVAMLEPVAAADAHEFTRAFYHGMFADLKAASDMLASRPQVPFEWTRPMYDARTAICDLHDGNAINVREWILPVLYVRGIEPLQFVRPPSGSQAKDDDLKFRARLVAGWLDAVREGLPEADRLTVMEKVLADVPRSYWPNVDGGFDHA